MFLCGYCYGNVQKLYRSQYNYRLKNIKSFLIKKYIEKKGVLQKITIGVCMSVVGVGNLEE